MSSWVIVGIILLVLGLILGNILLLKSSANMKLPSLKDAKVSENQEAKSSDNAKQNTNKSDY